MAATYAGRFDEAAARSTQAIAAAAPSPPSLAAGLGLLGSGLIELLRGRAERASLYLVEAEALLERCSDPPYRGLTHAGRGIAAHALGDLDAAERLLHESLQQSVALPFVRSRATAALSRLAFDQGRGQEAIARARECLEISYAAGDRALTVDALEALAEPMWSGGDTYGAARVLGAAHRLRTEADYILYPLHELRYAPLLALAKASPGWAEGLQLSTAEIVVWLGRGRGRRGRPTAGWESLTATEATVARLVAEGLTNPEIAAKLFVSRNTIKAHVAHVYAKLDINSRAQLADEVARRLSQA